MEFSATIPVEHLKGKVIVLKLLGEEKAEPLSLFFSRRHDDYIRSLCSIWRRDQIAQSFC